MDKEFAVISVRMRADEVQLLDTLADDLMRTRSSTIRYALREMTRKEKDGAVLVADPAGAAPRVSLRV